MTPEQVALLSDEELYRLMQVVDDPFQTGIIMWQLRRDLWHFAPGPGLVPVQVGGEVEQVYVDEFLWNIHARSLAIWNEVRGYLAGPNTFNKTLRLGIQAGAAVVSALGATAPPASAGAAPGASAAAGASDAAVVAEGAAETVGAGAAAGTAGTAATAAAAAGGASSAASSAPAAAAANAASTAANTASDVLGSVADFVDQAQEAIAGIVKPVADAIKTVSDIVTTINDGLIKPIVGPLVGTYKALETLADVIKRDLKGGLEGILRIPQDISNALTSIDASFQRALTMLGQSNADNITKLLIPGLSQGITAPLVASLEELQVALEGTSVIPGDYTPGKLTEPVSEAEVQAMVEKWVDELRNTDGILGQILKVIAKGIHTIPAALGLTYAWLATGKNIGYQALRPERLNPGQAVEAYIRDIIDFDSFKSEMRSQGYSDDRIDALFLLRRNFVGVSDVVDFWHRGLLSDTQTIQAISNLGYAQEDITRIMGASFTLPTLADVIYNVDRFAAIEQFGAPATLSTPPPDQVLEIARLRGISSKAAVTAWQNHWVLLSAADGVQAWFRGYITREQLNAILRFNALAPEQWDNFIDLQRPEVNALSIPGLIQANVITEVEGYDVLLRRGYTPESANWIIGKAAKAKLAPTQKVADSLEGLTSSTVLSLYDDGVLTTDQATELLGELGIGADAAGITLLMRDVNAQQAERKAEADLIVAQHNAGALGFEDAQAQLAQLGLTTIEVAKATTAMQKALLVKDKLPSESQVTRMYKAGILTRAEASQALGLLGYNVGWAELLLQLSEVKTDGNTGNQ